MAVHYETTLLVPDLERSIAFYEEVMGLAVRERSGTRASLETGESTLVLEGGHGQETLAAYGLQPPGENPGRGVLVSLMYDDLAPVYERALDHAEAEVLIDPRDADWGERLFLLRDPDGYVLDVSEPL